MRPLSSKIFTRTPKSQFLFHVLVKMYQKWNNLIYLSLGTSKTQKKKKKKRPLPSSPYNSRRRHPLGWKVEEGAGTSPCELPQLGRGKKWQFLGKTHTKWHLFSNLLFSYQNIKNYGVGPNSGLISNRFIE